VLIYANNPDADHLSDLLETEKVTTAESSRFEFTPDLSICRLLNGMWQVSGAHGY
jgi:hypothetical protein